MPEYRDVYDTGTNDVRPRLAVGTRVRVRWAEAEAAGIFIVCPYGVIGAVDQFWETFRVSIQIATLADPAQRPQAWYFSRSQLEVVEEL